MPNFDQRRNLTLEFFCQIIFPRVLSIVRKLQLFYSNIVFFVGRLKDICRSSSSDLPFKSDVVDVNSEMILIFLELFVKNVTRLLCLSHLARVSSWTDTNSLAKLLWRLILIAQLFGGGALKQIVLLDQPLVLLL